MKSNFSLVFILFILLITVGSCKKEVKMQQNDIQFSEIKLDTICHLLGDTAKPACKFSLEMQYPVSAHDPQTLKELQKIFVESYFGTTYQNQLPDQAAHAYMQTYIQDYLRLESDYTRFLESFKEAVTLASFNYEEISSSNVLFNACNFISFAIDVYNYTGGAHGMSKTANHVIDLNNMSQLVLADLFSDSSLPEIGQLIIQKIAKEHNYIDPSQLNDDGFFSIEEVMPTDNFIIDEKGITWVYNPYEIAVYATGRVTVSLDWPIVKPYLIEDSPVMKLVELNEK